MDQKIRARNFEATDESIETRVPAKARSKGRPVSVDKGSKENAINAKRKDSAPEETLVVSATMRMIVVKAMEPSSFAP